jgi:hypothetical protein
MTPTRYTESGAYLVPKLIDLKTAKRHNVPAHAVDAIHGTIAWTPEILIDGAGFGVMDKDGVTHYPIPLYKPAGATGLTPAGQ